MGKNKKKKGNKNNLVAPSPPSVVAASVETNIIYPMEFYEIVDAVEYAVNNKKPGSKEVFTADEWIHNLKGMLQYHLKANRRNLLELSRGVDTVNQLEEDPEETPECPRSVDMGRKFDERRPNLDADFYTCPRSDVLSKNGMPQEDVMNLGPTELNGTDEYNCLLYVIIQSLWRLGCFREEILKKPPHNDEDNGNPCVVCALFDIFTLLDKGDEAVPTTSLRTALSSSCPERYLFEEGHIKDASDVLYVLFNCLHYSFTWPSYFPVPESEDSNTSGYWDCTSSSCFVHTLFGMNVLEEMKCCFCSVKSRRLMYTCFSHDINASDLRTAKEMFPESSFDDILDHLEMQHMLPCDKEAGGCGNVNNIQHILSNPPPHVFTIVLDWQDTLAVADDDESIMKTLRAISDEMNVSSIYMDLDLKNRRSLVSMICYYGKHHYCFAYTDNHNKWMIKYVDKDKEVIGSWDDVLTKCVTAQLRPHVLFFEAVTP